MKVLILSINYWPEATGIGAFTTYRAEHLAASGHDVEVRTTFPYYPEWRVPAPHAGRLVQCNAAFSRGRAANLRHSRSCIEGPQDDIIEIAQQ